MKAQKPKRTRVSLSEDDLKDIKPDSRLYRRVIDLLEESEQGTPYLEYARDRLDKDGEIEFDEDAAVSLSADDGAYVMAWVWVSDEDMIENGYLERCEECAAAIPADTPSLVNSHHLPSCSLFSDSEIDNAKNQSTN